MNNIPLNELDIFVIASFAIIMFISWRRGLLLTLFSLFSFVIAIVITNTAYPTVGEYLRVNTTLYAQISDFVSKNINLGENLSQTTKPEQNQIIEGLNMPGVVTVSLIENNNPEVYAIIGANAIDEYITGITTEIIINIIAMMLVFVAVSIVLAFVSKSLRLVSRLPVINTFNKAGGLLLGAALATAFVWLIFTISFLFFPQYRIEITALIDESVLAKYFFESNSILKTALNIARSAG